MEQEKILSLLTEILSELKEIKIFLAPHSLSISEDNKYTIIPAEKV
jgi:hypothetical protein